MPGYYSSQWIRRVAQAASQGVPADFSEERKRFESSNGEEPILKADDLRNLLLGLDRRSHEQGQRAYRSPFSPFGKGSQSPFSLAHFDPSRCFRWEIKGARILGCLDLRDGRLPSGGSLPALEFSGCIFEGGFLADGAHLERLHFSGCRFSSNEAPRAEIGLRNVRIESELRISGLMSMAEKGILRINAENLYVGANITIKRTRLIAPENQEIVDPLKVEYALNLRNAVMRTDLLLYPGVVIHGGIMARGIRVGGDVRAFGLIASDGADAKYRGTIRAKTGRLRAAFALDGAHIHGDLWLASIDERNLVDLNGELSITGATIEGNLRLVRAALNSGDAEYPDAEVAKRQNQSGNAFSLGGTVVRGEFVWSNLHGIDGREVVTGVKGQVSLDQAVIGAALIFGPIALISARGLKVKRDLNVRTLLPVRQSAAAEGAPGKSENAYGQLNLTDASAEGSITVQADYLTQQWRPSGSAEGFICLDQARVTGNVTLMGTYDDVLIRDAVIEGNLEFLGVSGESRAAMIIYSLHLSKTRIGGDFRVSSLKFFSREYLPQYLKAKMQPPYFSLADAVIKRTFRLGRNSVAPDAEFKSAIICRPSCYPRFQIVEVRARRPETADNDFPSVAFLVRRGRTSTALDGGSAVFHTINRKRRELRLRTPDQRKDYLRLFCAYVWGDEGSFQIVEEIDQLPFFAKDGAAQPTVHPIQIKKHTNEAKFMLATACILYGNHLFEADFKLILHPHTETTGEKPQRLTRGDVQMLEDRPLFEFAPAKVPKYATPLRFPREVEEKNSEAQQTDFHPGEASVGWQPLNQVELNASVPGWWAPFKDDSASLYNSVVDLTGATCGTLEDSDGVAWGSDVVLSLENFTYDRIKASPELKRTSSPLWRLGAAFFAAWFKLRRQTDLAVQPLRFAIRSWLNLPQSSLPDLRSQEQQVRPRWYINLVNSWVRSTGVNERLQWLEQHKSYEPLMQQPYVQLAKVFREQGDELEARLVEAQRIRVDRWHRAKRSFEGKLALPFFGLFRIFFFYGLKPLRASGTFTLCIALGWIAVTIANHEHLLTQTTATVATAVSLDDPSTPVVPYQQTQGQSEFYCGSSISEPLYAVDVFIPLLDLRQEGRCDIRTVSAKDVSPPTAFRQRPGRITTKAVAFVTALASYPTTWQWLKAAYALLGWLVTSLTLLTLSGAFRKWEQSR